MNEKIQKLSDICNQLNSLLPEESEIRFTVRFNEFGEYICAELDIFAYIDDDVERGQAMDGHTCRRRALNQLLNVAAYLSETPDDRAAILRMAHEAAEAVNLEDEIERNL